MSNVALTKWQPVPGETRYKKFFKPYNKRTVTIILSNFAPGHYFWPIDMPESDKEVRKAQFESRFKFI